ncbi:DUF3124 domain-containing protein [Desulfatirhabdium butyrativorans]|uniref:DUF3124 domain-containing protein n=1 Tax=Desulfatirhabdium butyrativorans TaxID=340467 RepID=UPI0004021976|nr:DUF3124 domain-containing protein [Desulfatirhabdium butyrativorans]
MRTPGLKTVLWFFLTIGCWIAVCGTAEAEVRHLSGQTLYVPAYSHIYYGDRERPMLLTVTLSVRNTDLSAPISLQSVEYYDSNGKRVSSMIQEPMPLAPLSSTRFVIKESDASGGSGACFVVRWKSAKPVTEPVVESIMINTQSQLGISFTSPARVLEEIIAR